MKFPPKRIEEALFEEKVKKIVPKKIKTQILHKGYAKRALLVFLEFPKCAPNTIKLSMAVTKKNSAKKKLKLFKKI